MTRTEFCLFTAQEDLETMQAYAQVGHRPAACKPGAKVPVVAGAGEWKMMILFLMKTGF